MAQKLSECETWYGYVYHTQHFPVTLGIIYDMKEGHETFENQIVCMIAGFIGSIIMLKVDGWC